MEAYNQGVLASLLPASTRQYAKPSIWPQVTPQNITLKNRGTLQQEEDAPMKEPPMEEQEEITQEESTLPTIFFVILGIALLVGIMAGLLM